MHRHIGIYAGAFDPVHQGHIAFAREAKDFFGLDSVAFLPEASPYHKPQITDVQHRIALLRHELAAYPGLCVAQLRTPRFTVQAALPEIYPRFGRSGLVFLFGSDVVPSFVHWPGIDLLLKNHVFAIGLRAQNTEADVAQAFAVLEANYRIPIRWVALRTSNHAASSTAVKTQGDGFAGMSAGARQYIRDQGLYIA